MVIKPKEDEKPLDNSKLDIFMKPFTQEEVLYVMTSPDINTRCEVCRYFRQKELYDPCLIVPNDIPMAIVAGGSCSQFQALGVIAPNEDSSEDSLEEGTEAGHLDEEDEDDVPGKTIIQKGLEVVTNFLKKDSGRASQTGFDSLSGFKVFAVDDKFYWLGWYSNNFKDLEEDIFTLSGFDVYNQRVSSGMYKPPDLWCMHQEYLKHGEGLKTFRIGHFQFALGIFDDPQVNPLVGPFIKFYEENPATMSHGFVYDPKHYIDNTFNVWKTFEVSTVKVGREANPYFTSFEVLKEHKMLDGNDRTFVESIIGAEMLQSLEKSAETRGKALEAEGIAFKSLSGEDSVSSDTSAILMSLKFINDKTDKQLEQAVEAVALSAKVWVTADQRLELLEQTVDRIKHNVTALLNPETASKSDSTTLDEDNTAAQHLIDKNVGDQNSRKLSVLEEMAISMGDDPKNYANTGS